ncbi:MAG: hypothetical protein PVH88_00085 [Ignavibacteria bacterium]|jgi:hypothetical protein
MKIINYLYISFITLFVISCIDPPEDFVAPIWNVEFNAPLTSRSYTLEEAIETDTSITWITSSDNTDNIGLLVFADTNELENIKIEDNLTLDDFSSQSSEVIGSIKINDVDPFNSFVTVEEFVGIPAGTSSTFPENRSNIQNEFSEIDEFVSVDMSGGTINLNFVNKLPVELQFERVQIKRLSTNELLLEITDNLPLVVAKNSQGDMQLDLSGVVFYEDMMVDLTVYTSGSNGEIVTIEDDAGFDVVSSISNLEISRTTAVLPEQDPFTEINTSTMDDSTFVETATFNNGSFEIMIDNFMDLAMDVEINIENLFDPSGNSFSRDVSLSRKETNKTISVGDLNGWKIKTTNPGNPTNEIEYKAIFTVQESDDARELSENDSVSVEVKFENSDFSFIEGKFKPTSFDINETNFDFDFGNFNDRFTTETIEFAQPSIYLNLTSTANIDIDLNAELIGTNGTQSESLFLNNVRVYGATKTKIDLNDYGLTDFLNSFTGKLPNQFYMTGTAIANPNYIYGSASSEDFVEGFTEVEIPLYIGINGGSIKDTVDIDLGDLDENDLENINDADLTIEVTNGIAATAKLTAFVLDDSGNITLYIPPSQNSVDYISIKAPSIDSDGNVTSKASNTEVFNLSGDDIKKIIYGKKMGVNIELDTRSTGSTDPVKFKNTDEISFRVSVTGNYKTDFDNED